MNNSPIKITTTAPASQAERIAAYQARRAAKVERLEDSAAKARQESESRLATARSMASAIPFGQPMMPDHYSYKRDRSFRERIGANFDKGFEALHKAEHLERRAATAASEHGIASDDPTALEKLRAKVAELTASQEQMKAANAAIRKHRKAGTEAQVAALVELGFKPADAATLVLPPNSWQSVGFPSYRLSNNNANLRRYKSRLAQLERVQDKPIVEAENEESGIRYEDNPQENRIRLYFPGKPSAEDRTKLKRNGFRWAPSIGAWQAYRNRHTDHTARDFAGLPQSQY